MEALRIIQWGDSVLDADGETVHQLCPRCDQVEKNGHSPDCEVGAVLEAAHERGERAERTRNLAQAASVRDLEAKRETNPKGEKEDCF